MASLSGTVYWVTRRHGDPTQGLSQFTIYDSSASNGDTLATSMQTDNGFNVQITANDSNVFGGYTFDSDGVVTFILQNSAGTAVNGKKISVMVTGIEKNTNAAKEPPFLR